MCAFVVLGFVFSYQAKRLVWEVTSPKWPILCWVGCKTLTSLVALPHFCPAVFCVSQLCWDPCCSCIYTRAAVLVTGVVGLLLNVRGTMRSYTQPVRWSAAWCWTMTRFIPFPLMLSVILDCVDLLENIVVFAKDGFRSEVPSHVVVSHFYTRQSATLTCRAAEFLTSNTSATSRA